METREALRHIFWLGGASGSGKSTIAKLVAAQHGLALQHRDQWNEVHARRVDPQRQPNMAWVIERKQWLRTGEGSSDVSTKEVLHHLIRSQHEDWAFTLEDLRGEPIETPTLLEGARLIPDVVLPQIQDRRRAAWLVPSAELLSEQVLTQSIERFGAAGTDVEAAVQRRLLQMVAQSEAIARAAEDQGGTVLRFETEEERDQLPDNLAGAYGL